MQLLQGHEDLLTVFRRRFAPATWCQGLADSVKEDVFGAGGWAWGSPMRGGLWDILLTFSSFLFHHPGVAKGCRRPQALTEPFQPLQATWGKEDGPFMAPPVDSQDSPGASRARELAASRVHDERHSWLKDHMLRALTRSKRFHVALRLNTKFLCGTATGDRLA